MNNKGFTLIELIVCLVLVALVFGFGFGMIRGTRSSILTTIDKISESELINAAKTYVLENNVNWFNEDDNIYTCVSVDDMINSKYLSKEETIDYNNQFVKVVKNNNTRVITDLIILEECN